MFSRAFKRSSQIPGCPPEDFEEWDGNQDVGDRGKARATNAQEENYIDIPSIYGSSQIAMFGPQFGTPSLSLRQERSRPRSAPRTQVSTGNLEASQPMSLASQIPGQNSASTSRLPSSLMKGIGSLFK